MNWQRVVKAAPRFAASGDFVMEYKRGHSVGIDISSVVRGFSKHLRGRQTLAEAAGYVVSGRKSLCSVWQKIPVVR